MTQSPKNDNKGQKQRKRERLLKNQDGRCFYCGDTLKSANSGDSTLEHIIPRSHGGGKKKNLVLTCPQCNYLRGNLMSLEEAQSMIRKFVKTINKLAEMGILK